MDLEDYRKEIDRLNSEIADAISRRMNIVEEIGQYKRENDMDIVDKGREQIVKQQFEKIFEQKDLPKEKGRELGEYLIDMAIEKEREE